MTEIKAEIIADSLGVKGDRATSFVLTFPRYILAELNTHRLFTRNSASSRAIPFKKMLERVQTDPFIPVAWQKDHSGMQGTEYFTDPQQTAYLNNQWKFARNNAVNAASLLYSNQIASPVTKQMVNRLLEPFMWHTCILTATEFDNFFNLRSSNYEWSKNMVSPLSHRSIKEVLTSMRRVGVNTSVIEQSPIVEWLKMNKGQADIHFMLLVEAMWDAMAASEPKQLEAGDWHIPFGDNMDDERLHQIITEDKSTVSDYESQMNKAKIKIATARCARVSYLNYEGKDDYAADIALFDKLSTSGHWSPFEHCAKAMSIDEYEEYSHNIPHRDKNGKIIGCDIDPGWCRNFKGFIQLRALMDQK